MAVKPRFWTAVTIFLGSYMPLSLILLVQDIGKASCPLRQTLFIKHPFLSIPPVAATFACLLATILLLNRIPKTRRFKITESKYIPSEMINYTFPYIVAFVNVDYDDRMKLLGFCIFSITLFIMTHCAGRIFVNPLLIVFGWRAFEVTYTFAGDSVLRKTLALAKVSELSIGFAEGTQIEDLLVLGRVSGA